MTWQIKPPPDWQVDALCQFVDPELFFAEVEVGRNTTQDAKRICRRCDVQPQCLDWALDNDDQHGVLGGLAPRERRNLRRAA